MLGVADDARDHQLENYPKVQYPVVHSLSEEGVAPRFADHHVGHLDDHYTDEEGRVACVLENLALLVRPFLPETVLQIVHDYAIPRGSQVQQRVRRFRYTLGQGLPLGPIAQTGNPGQIVESSIADVFPPRVGDHHLPQLAAVPHVPDLERELD